MSEGNVQVLLVEDNLGDARLIQEFLAEVPSNNFRLEIVHDLPDALARLTSGGIDVVLLDLHLPGISGLETFNAINTAAPSLPIVILSGMADQALAEAAIAQGAQDYLVKGRIVEDLLTRSIHYSIERKRREEAYGKIVEALREAHDQLKELSLSDPLTGLSNRRGLEVKASQYLKLAKRHKQHAFLFFIDIDHMKQINDTLGHNEGDMVLKEVANILKDCFRETDIIARLGGDEFCVLVTMTNAGDEKIIIDKLQNLVTQRNATCRPLHKPFSLSIGGVSCDLHQSVDLEVLLGRADKMMYIQKGLKKT